MGKKEKNKGKEQVVEQVQSAVNTYSSPSQLEITDLRVTRVAASYDYFLIKIDTNQGVYGIGEGHESSHIENILQYKSLLLGKNPCGVDLLFNLMKPYGNFASEGSGVSGIEIALWDLVGRVYGVPCYQFLGGKYRDRVRLYADTPSPKDPTPESYAERIRHRKSQGLTIIKFDVQMGRLIELDARSVIGKPTQGMMPGAPGMFRGAVGTQLTDRGLKHMQEIVAACREAAGPDIPLAIDHFGPLSVVDAIRMGHALEGYGIAWLEDIMGVRNVAATREVTRAINVPTLDGEQGYLLDGLREMIETHAVDILQPDLVTVGGMAECKRVADHANKFGLPVVLHCAGSPIMFMANIHCAAAVRNFIAQEIHSLDIPYWRDLVIGLDEPLIEDGYVRVPEKPGIGLELNEEVIREHLRYYGYFDATDDWNRPKLGWWIPPEQPHD